MPTRAVAYVRVSTERQADQGLSLEAQQARLQQYAALYDLQIVETVVDAGKSAKTLKRPGLQKALGMLKAGEADALLVMKLDRLTRRLRDLADLLDAYFAEGKQWRLLSVSEQIDTRSASGRLVLNLLAAVNQWEREANAERTEEVMHYKASRGEYLGGRVPYGWRVAPDGVHLLPEPEEQRVLDKARKLHKQGRSLRTVAAALSRSGFRSRAGKPFDAKQIARMVAA